MKTLVSVIVAAYNSAPFIIETLQSIYNQTWKELELIITDDCSTDSTVNVCRKWLSENGRRFIHSGLLTTEKNTGVSANANRGLFHAKGDWIKLLGADDTLKPDCIKDNIFWIESHDNVKALLSRIEIYQNTFEYQNLIETVPGTPYDPDGLMAPGRSAESQYRLLLLNDRIHFTPSVFLHRKTLLEIGGFDERFKMLEDYPLWLNLTRKGYKLHFMDKITVNYRRHLKAINNTGIPYLINPNYFRSESFRRIYTYPNMPVDIRLSAKFHWYGSQIFRLKWLNRNKKSNRLLYELITVYLNPFRYFIFIKKMLLKNLKNSEFYK